MVKEPDMNIAAYIDHTVLKPTTTLQEVQQCCEEALHYQFAAVCIPPPFVTTTKKFLQGSEVKTSTVIGFPFGYSSTQAKVTEISQAISDGVDELDMVINIIDIKNNYWDNIDKELSIVMPRIKDNNKIIKLIIESGILTEKEIITCCKLAVKHEVDFVKTSTGYAEKGATLEAVHLIRKTLPSFVKIKASGGIRTYEMAKAFIEAGASRLGCSSSVSIVEQSKNKSALHE